MAELGGAYAFTGEAYTQPRARVPGVRVPGNNLRSTGIAFTPAEKNGMGIRQQHLYELR